MTRPRICLFPQISAFPDKNEHSIMRQFPHAVAFPQTIDRSFTLAFVLTFPRSKHMEASKIQHIPRWLRLYADSIQPPRSPRFTSLKSFVACMRCSTIPSWIFVSSVSLYFIWSFAWCYENDSFELRVRFL